MKIVIFGLTISSSWGNGHATLWRGLCRALAGQGHKIVFYERDTEFYAGARDLHALPGGELVLYRSFQDIKRRVEWDLECTGAAIVTSYCPDALAAFDLIRASSAVSVFYDLDTPVTLHRQGRGENVDYIGPDGLAEYDLVLSFTGGEALRALREMFGARRVYPLYGHVDPEIHHPIPPAREFFSDLSYLGTYAADRQEKLETLFVEPARRRPSQRFFLAGAQYPQDFPWQENIHFARHLDPGDHARFLCSSRLTLNITRREMARMGWCPSGRVFEAAACGAPVISDWWDGLGSYFEPGQEILIVQSTDDVLAALEMDDDALAEIGRAARARVLAEHTSAHRARELMQLLAEPRQRHSESFLQQAEP